MYELLRKSLQWKQRYSWRSILFSN